MAATMVTETVDRAYETTLTEGVLYERRAFNGMFATNDKKESMSAFLKQIGRISHIVDSL